MKYEACFVLFFLGKTRKNNINLLSADLAKRVVKIKGHFSL